MHNLALFDLDGTLTDPAEGIVGSLEHGMAWHGCGRRRPGTTPTIGAVHRAKAAMIGDRDVDIKAGKADGLSTIGNVWGYGSVEEIIDAAPSALIGQPSEISEALNLCV